MYTEKISFTPNGLENFYWEKGKEHHELIRFPIPFLLQECRIEENTTIRHILNYIKSNESLLDFLIDMTYSHPIREWLEQLYLEPDKDVMIKELFIHWDNNSFANTFVSKPQLLGKYVEDGKIIHSLIGGTKLNRFVDLPLKLETNFEIMEFHKEDSLPFAEYVGLYHLEEEDCLPPVPPSQSFGHKQFSVLDILQTILQDITCYGTPAEAKVMFDDLHQRIEEARKHPERSIPAEEVFERLNKDLKNRG